MPLSALSASLRPKTGFSEFVKSSKLSPPPTTGNLTAMFENLTAFLPLLPLILQHHHHLHWPGRHLDPLHHKVCAPTPQSGMLQPVSRSYCLLPPSLIYQTYKPNIFYNLTLEWYSKLKYKTPKQKQIFHREKNLTAFPQSLAPGIISCFPPPPPPIGSEQ